MEVLAVGLVLAGISSWFWLCRSGPPNEDRLRKLAFQPRIQRIRNWLCQRFRRENKMGLTLTVGVAVSLLAGWLFGELADEILEEELLTQLDLTLGEGLLGVVSEPVSQLFYGITMIASPVVLITGVVLTSLWLVKRGDKADAVLVLVTVGGGALINFLLKLLFSRPRPSFIDMFYQEVGFSFPSGHAMLSVLFFGVLAYLIWRPLHTVRWRIAVVMAAAIIALFVGISRLVLGVHFLSDVLAGWAAGIVWLSACITTREVGRR